MKMTWRELSKLASDDQAKFLVTKKPFTDMPDHYMAAWLDACEGHGLDIRQSVSALIFAMGSVGTDLDSWIYGDDLAMYVDTVLVAEG